MIRTRVSKKISLLFVGDIFLLYAALWATLAIRYLPRERGPVFQSHLVPFTIVFSLWLALIGAFGLYELRLLKNSKLFLYRLVQIMTINTVCAIVFFYVFPFEIEPRRNLLLIAATATVFFFTWRVLFNMIVPRAPAVRAIFLGGTPEMTELAQWITANPQLGFKAVAIVSHDKETSSPPLPPLAHLSATSGDLTRVIRDTKVQMVVISPEMKHNAGIVQGLFGAIGLGVSVIDFPAFHEMLTGKIPLSLIAEAWFLENLIGIKKRSYEAGKRVFDCVLALALGIPALIIFPIIALAIKLDSTGPVFFRQKRVGRNGREFTLIKYRSMIENAQTIGGHKEIPMDTRHTRVGAVLRKNYLDEIPQLINIIRGDMSFVGPRPERPEYVDNLKMRVPFYEMRLLVTPGATGWAHVNMENDASVEDAPEKMQYDLYYVKNRSFLLDMLILLRSLFILIKRNGR
jgi:exopolysaccharide biosynthesis polyprenyl glycosylphosphotransferase